MPVGKTVARLSTSTVTPFQPQEIVARQATAEAAITYAKQVKDWPLLEEAVDAKLKDQAEFVGWWEEHVTIRHGLGRGKKNAERGSFSVEKVEKETSIRQQQVSKWRRRLAEPEKYRAMLFGSAYAKAMAETDGNRATEWSGDPEYYTPAQYIEAARAVLGAIDLDPASNPIAQKVVQAAEWYGEQQDGLKQAWRGRVFLNPPYKFPLVGEFTAKLVSEVLAGNIRAAILLTNNCTDTKWWHEAARTSAAICFTLGRINFYQADGEPQKQPTNGQTFLYFGADHDAFARTFGAFGLVVEPLA